MIIKTPILVRSSEQMRHVNILLCTSRRQHVLIIACREMAVVCR